MRALSPAPVTSPLRSSSDDSEAMSVSSSKNESGIKSKDGARKSAIPVSQGQDGTGTWITRHGHGHGLSIGCLHQPMDDCRPGTVPCLRSMPTSSLLLSAQRTRGNIFTHLIVRSACFRSPTHALVPPACKRHFITQSGMRVRELLTRKKGSAKKMKPVAQLSDLMQEVSRMANRENMCSL